MNFLARISDDKFDVGTLEFFCSILSLLCSVFKGMLTVQLRKDNPGLTAPISAVTTPAEGHTLQTYAKVYFRYVN